MLTVKSGVHVRKFLGFLVVLISIALGLMLARPEQKQIVRVTPVITESHQDTQTLPEALPEALPETVAETAPDTSLDKVADKVTVPVVPLAPQLPDYAPEPPAPPIPPQKPRPVQIAIIIDDIGLNIRNSEAVMALPAPITLAFLPYAKNLNRQMNQAIEAGHELLLHMPMEPFGQEDPGPDALLTEMSDNDIQIKLVRALSMMPQAIGLNNHMGSKFTSNAAKMRLVLAELKARDLAFIDSRTAPQSVAYMLAQQMGVKHAGRDIFLDNDPSLSAIRAQLAALEQIAYKQGSAIAIGHPYDNTIAALKEWLPEIADKKITIVPVSYLLK